MNKYLESTEYIDWDNPLIFSQAKKLAEGASSNEQVARSCFEFVRDEIKHSWDFKLNHVTCKASDVLRYGTGFCYAKSHLLAALLRANGIPAGLCYQRLTMADTLSLSLHGLNAVYLETYGWYRIDARGNKEGVSAEFCPPQEKLAFPITKDGEADVPEILAKPLSVVTDVLNQYQFIQDVSDNLPDIEI